MNVIDKRTEPTQLELCFQQFRKNSIGINHKFLTPYGSKQIIYTDTDWTAIGPLYRLISVMLKQ